MLRKLLRRGHSEKMGFSFGLTSGIITTLGLMVGLDSSTNSRLAVLGGILTIAVADAFSDALGIHISEESENKHTGKEIWASTASTWLTKFVVALTFAVPVLLLTLDSAIVASIIWGLSLLEIFSFFLAKSQNVPAWRVVAEHMLIAVVVIAVTRYSGHLIGQAFF
jgi:VIT1/CCC1 family predicted Fe2+/Mn2+ transporter